MAICRISVRLGPHLAQLTVWCNDGGEKLLGQHIHRMSICSNVTSGRCILAQDGGHNSPGLSDSPGRPMVDGRRPGILCKEVTVM